MTSDNFDAIFESTVEMARKVLVDKAKGYADASDRLHNFKRSAAFTRETPAQVCVGFMVKHLTSIADMVDRQATGIVPQDNDIHEKFGDAINYLVLLKALVFEAKS